MNLRKDHYRVSLATSTQPAATLGGSGAARALRNGHWPGLGRVRYLPLPSGPRGCEVQRAALARQRASLRGRLCRHTVSVPVACTQRRHARRKWRHAHAAAGRSGRGAPRARPPGMARSARTLKRRHARRKWCHARAAAGRSGRGAPRARPPGMARSARTLKRRHARRKWCRARAAAGRSG